MGSLEKESGLSTYFPWLTGTNAGPNQGMQATADSARSCLAPAVCRA